MATATATAPAPESITNPTDATFVACPDTDLNASNRIKGFLGLTGEIVPALPADPVAHVKALSNEELFPLGEKALRDIADDIIVLDEIRNRFRAANGRMILGYASWREFVEKNTLYSIRTIQRRLAEKNGKDLSKINVQPGNMYTRINVQYEEPKPEQINISVGVDEANDEPEIVAFPVASELDAGASVFEELISALYSLTKSGNDGVEHKFVALLNDAASYLKANPTLEEGAKSSRNTVVYLLNRVAKEFQEHAAMLSKSAEVV